MNKKYQKIKQKKNIYKEQKKFGRKIMIKYIEKNIRKYF